MNVHVSQNHLTTEAERTKHTIDVLRLLYVRLGHIQSIIGDIGVALKNGRIDPDHARMLADSAAPGCFDAVAGDI